MVIFPDAFIMRIINHNIVTITQETRAIPRYGALPSINYLWKQLYEYLASTMQELNRLINTGGDEHQILHYVLSIFAIEVCLEDKSVCGVTDISLRVPSSILPGKFMPKGSLLW